MKRRKFMHILAGLGTLLLTGATLTWLWQRNSAERQRMAELMGLPPVQDEVTEEGKDAVRDADRLWQRLMLRGQINGYQASVWQRFWYLSPGDSRPYLRMPFCMFAFRLPAPAPVQLIIEPQGLAEDVPPLVSRWSTWQTGDPAFDVEARTTSPQPAQAAAWLTPELRGYVLDFFKRFACDDPLNYRTDLRRAVLGWFEVETARVTYTTFGQADQVTAKRLWCAAPVLSELARAASL
jgi:hypothetical protein